MTEERHEYLYQNRPPGIGCQPEGSIDREAWLPARHHESGGPARHFLGGVTYARKLDYSEIRRYELWPVDELERAEMVFLREGEDADWLRKDYLSQPVEKLELYADRDQKAAAALIILKHQREDSNA